MLLKTGLFTEYPMWFLMFCLLLGAALAALLYLRSKQFAGIKNGLLFKRLMAGFRFLGVSLIAFLLLGPFFRKKFTKAEKPILLVVQDNSVSILESFKKLDSAAYQESISDLWLSLSDDFEVKHYLVGEKLEKGERADFGDLATNLSSGLSEVLSLHENQNLGAVMLLSDGIFNQGTSPVFASQKTIAPVYTMALGDSSTRKDFQMRKAYYNRIAYLGDEMEVKLDIRALRMKGKKAQVSLSAISPKGGKLPPPQRVVFGSRNDQKELRFQIALNKAGVHHYRATIGRGEGEENLSNNSADIYIEVLDGRKKVLFAAHAPHPDLSALKAALESSKNYEVDLAIGEDLGNVNGQYDLILMHQLPSAKYKAKQILNRAQAQKTPLLFMLGSRTDISRLNKLDLGLRIENSRGEKVNAVFPAAQDNSFELFNLDQADWTFLKKLPPLLAPFGKFKTDGNFKSFANQKIGSVSTDYPLIGFIEKGNNKLGFICAEGIWKWRLFNFQEKQNHDFFNTLMGKSFQFLSTKDDKRKFRVIASKRLFNENERVDLEAELYNASFELINEPDVTLEVRSEQGDLFEYTFNRRANAYAVDLGLFDVGSYSYTAKTNFDGQSFQASGRFSVRPLQLEQLALQANHKLLQLMAQENNGAMFFPNEIADLEKALKGNDRIKTVLRESEESRSLINLKWLFFVFFGLIALEWFARKYLGEY